MGYVYPSLDKMPFLAGLPPISDSARVRKKNHNVESHRDSNHTNLHSGELLNHAAIDALRLWIYEINEKKLTVIVEPLLRTLFKKSWTFVIFVFIFLLLLLFNCLLAMTLSLVTRLFHVRFDGTVKMYK